MNELSVNVEVPRGHFPPMGLAEARAKVTARDLTDDPPELRRQLRPQPGGLDAGPAQPPCQPARRVPPEQ